MVKIKKIHYNTEVNFWLSLSLVFGTPPNPPCELEPKEKKLSLFQGPLLFPRPFTYHSLRGNLGVIISYSSLSSLYYKTISLALLLPE